MEKKNAFSLVVSDFLDPIVYWKSNDWKWIIYVYFLRALCCFWSDMWYREVKKFEENAMQVLLWAVK